MLLDIPEFTDDPTTELSDPLHQWCRGWETLPSRLLGFHFQNGITIITTTTIMGLPDSSAGKEATCNAGDLGSIPGLGRFPWRRGNPTHSSILAWRIPWTVCIVHGVAKSWT